MNKRRAGIEATNSELNRSHGLGKVRVRGAPAVRLASASRLFGAGPNSCIPSAGADDITVVPLFFQTILC